MRRLLAILAALGLSSLALAQAIPYPAPEISSGGVILGTAVADAGVSGTWTNLGTFTNDGVLATNGLVNTGTEIADAGVFNVLSDNGESVTGFLGVDGGLGVAGGEVLATAGLRVSGIFDISNSGGNALIQSGFAGANMRFSPATYTEFDNYITGISGAQLNVMAGENIWGPVKITTDGGENGSLAVGGGTAITNLGLGSCSLSSGQCNAVVAGATGASLCFAGVQGTSQTLVGCDARADAGSATAFCQSTASGTAAIFCVN